MSLTTTDILIYLTEDILYSVFGICPTSQWPTSRDSWWLQTFALLPIHKPQNWSKVHRLQFVGEIVGREMKGHIFLLDSRQSSCLLVGNLVPYPSDVIANTSMTL